MNATERLLILGTAATYQPDERVEALRLVQEGIDWELFHELAEVNATGPLVWRNLAALNLADRVPADVRARFEERAQAIREANEARLKNARDLFARFAARQIPVVILKGVLFAETIYRDPYYKKMNDVDILIRRRDLDAIYDIYEEMRLFSAAELVGGSPRKQEKFSHHAPPFFSRDLKLMVGTHWGLITPLAPYTLDYDAIWSRVVDIDFYGHPAKAMAPEDNLHHLCVHLPYYKCGLRELADIANMVRHQSIDWDLFAAEMTKAKTENLVYHALSLVHARLADAGGAGGHRSARSRRRRTTSAMTPIANARASRASCAGARRTCRPSRRPTAISTRPAIRSRSGAPTARMWRGMLFPPREDVLKMNALERCARPAARGGAAAGAVARLSGVRARRGRRHLLRHSGQVRVRLSAGHRQGAVRGT